MSKLGNKLNMRQRVIATATVFFRRFYLKNSYCETDPYLVLAACCYVAAKAEESPVHIKTMIMEARNVLSEYSIRHFPTDNSKLAEMEFYLVDDLDCDLVVFHPYRTLMTLVRDTSQIEQDSDKEAGELGAGIDGPRYWGTGEGKLDMHTGGIQNAWFLINDTYRSDICLLYPPHLIAIAALYLICVLNPFVRQAHMEWMELKQAAVAAAQNQAGPSTRRSLRHANASASGSAPAGSQSQKRPQSTSADTVSEEAAVRKPNVPPQDFVGFFANLNVNMRLVAAIAQEMISFYALCDRLKEDFNPIGSATHGHAQASSAGQLPWTRSQPQTQALGAGGRSITPADAISEDVSRTATGSASNLDVDSMFLVQLLNRMRALKEADVAHPASGRPVAVNRMLERTQAAG